MAIGDVVWCPDCKSYDIGLVSESGEYFVNDETGELVMLPVAKLHCNDCSYRFSHTWDHGYTWVGEDEEDVFGGTLW